MYAGNLVSQPRHPAIVSLVLSLALPSLVGCQAQVLPNDEPSNVPPGGCAGGSTRGGGSRNGDTTGGKIQLPDASVSSGGKDACVARTCDYVGG
jgi:hypothetical protein